MTLRVAINGFGRIGRNVMRGWISRGADTDRADHGYQHLALAINIASLDRAQHPPERKDASA